MVSSTWKNLSIIWFKIDLPMGGSGLPSNMWFRMSLPSMASGSVKLFLHISRMSQHTHRDYAMCNSDSINLHLHRVPKLATPLQISWCTTVKSLILNRFLQNVKHSWRWSFWTSLWSLCSKWPPLVSTQALRWVRHCLIALSIIRWSSSSHTVWICWCSSSTLLTFTLYTCSWSTNQTL